LQIVSGAGRYIGPVVLHKGPETSDKACRKHRASCPIDDWLGLGAVTKNSISLGLISGKNPSGGIATWFLDAGVPASLRGNYIVRAGNKGGQPRGAGHLGLLKNGIPDVKISHGTKLIPAGGQSHKKAHESSSSEIAGADPANGVYSEACPSTNDPAVAEAPSETIANGEQTANGPAPSETVQHALSATSSQGPGNGTTPGPGSGPPGSGSSGGPAPGSSPGTAPGQELDCSGIPNIANADTSGSGMLNAVNPNPASLQASGLTLWEQLQLPAQYADNWHNGNSLTATQIEDALGGVQASRSFRVQFFVPYQDVLPGSTTIAGIRASVNCNGIVWCTGNGTIPQVAYPSLNSYDGPWAATTSLGGPYALVDESGQGVVRAEVYPGDSSPEVLSQLAPEQVLDIEASQNGGGRVTTPIALSPYMITTPWVAGASYAPVNGTPEVEMTADSSDHNPSNGTINMTIDRPQREALPGEASTTGYMDQTGLDYAVTVASDNDNMPSPSVQCPASSYANVVGLTATGKSAPGAPFADATTHDFDPASPPPGSTMSFTLNLVSCLAAAGQSFNGTYLVELNAVGQAMTGGNPDSELQFVVIS